MQLSVGDTIVHPRHGIGQITNTTHQELVEGFEDYYEIEIPEKRLKMHIPFGKVETMGVRPVMQPAKLDRVLDVLRSRPIQLPDNIKIRKKELQAKLDAARPLQVAELIRDLTWRKEIAHLTKVDSDILSKGQQLLAAEMAVVTDTEPLKATKMINAALTVAMTNGAD